MSSYSDSGSDTYTDTKGKYIAFDCETTGLNDNCNLLTVSFIVLDKSLNELSCLNLSLKQTNGYFIYPESLEVNKINLISHHKTALPLIDARRKLFNFLQTYKGQFNFIPIGHNIQFDIKFIKNSGLLTDSEYSNYFSYNNIDTIGIAQFLKLSNVLPEKQSLSLINLCSYANLERQENLEHSAEYDIRMTIKLLKFFNSQVHSNISNKKRKLSSK